VGGGCFLVIADEDENGGEEAHIGDYRVQVS